MQLGCVAWIGGVVKRSTFWGVGLVAFIYIVFSPKAQAQPSHVYDVAVAAPGQAPVRLHAEEHGSGPPLVLLHGLGGSGYSFRHIVGPLAQSHRVITLDLKGFGASEKPMDANYRPIDHAVLVATFLRQRRLSGVTLAGHSYGGAVALLTTLLLNQNEPWRVRRLVLMNTPAFPQPLPRAHHLLTLPVISYVVLAVVPPILNTRAALTSRLRTGPLATDADAKVYAEPLYDAAGRHALIATSRAVVETENESFIPYFRSIRQPALLVWCRADSTVPLATGERLHATLPRSRLAVLERCNHKPAEEQPAETASLIRDFARRH
jgi:pimeloyl-ACP methyl ester carboxylesterase